MIEAGHLSERTACKLAGISRTAYRYQARLPRDGALRARLKALAVQQSAYGYLLLHGILKAEGLVVNKKHTYRLYTEEGLQVCTKKRKKLQRPQAVNGDTQGRQSALVDGFRFSPAQRWQTVSSIECGR